MLTIQNQEQLPKNYAEIYKYSSQPNRFSLKNLQQFEDNLILVYSIIPSGMDHLSCRFGIKFTVEYLF